MSPPSKKPSQNSKDIRIAATSKIWSSAIAMLALCIPLSAVTRSGPILPLAVVVGTSLGTASIWKGSSEESTGDRASAEKIQQLEARIADLETIITSEEINWQQSLEPSSKITVLDKVASSEERAKTESK